MFLKIPKNCPLFVDIEEKNMDSLLGCLGARRQIYSKDEFVFRADEPARYVGIVLCGSVYVIQEDYWGNRTILTHVGPGELFGEAFACAGAARLPVSVIATEATEILRIDYQKITTVCPSACVYHARLISNMMRILAEKNMKLAGKIGHLAKRTIREKILSFLSAEAVEAGSNEVTISFNRQGMADYLCVERSALSRELALMKKAGLLDYDKSWFRLP